MSDKNLANAALNALKAIDAIYEWVDRVEAQGGAASMSGIAACHAMLQSLRKNRARTEQLIVAPLKAALARSALHPTGTEKSDA